MHGKDLTMEKRVKLFRISLFTGQYQNNIHFLKFERIWKFAIEDHWIAALCELTPLHPRDQIRRQISALSRTSSQLAPNWKVKALGLAWLGFAHTGLTPQQFTLGWPLPKSDQYWIRKSNESAAVAWWPPLSPSGSPIPIFQQGYNPSVKASVVKQLEKVLMIRTELTSHSEETWGIIVIGINFNNHTNRKPDEEIVATAMWQFNSYWRSQGSIAEPLWDFTSW